MKLEITRAFSVLAAVAVFAAASVVWSEPSMTVLTAENGLGYCPAHDASAHLSDRQPSEDLLLLMFSLSQGRGSLG
jgi:hypothetical protein